MAKQPATPATTSLPKGFSYTASLERLRALTEALQDAELPFEARVKHFEEGKTLLAQCQQYLDQVELVFETADPAAD